MHCTECGTKLVPDHLWRHAETRQARKALGQHRHAGRGLCGRCHSRAAERGTLVDHPRKTRRGEDVVEDWLELRDQGYSRRNAAYRLGMKPNTFDRVLNRAIHRGLLTQEQAQTKPSVEARTAEAWSNVNGRRLAA